MFVERPNKRRLLAHLLKDHDVESAIVFTRTKHGANRVLKDLGKAGIEALAIHGNKSQGARTRALAAFKSREIRILVATDIASRGIDVSGVSHVFNLIYLTYRNPMYIASVVPPAQVVMGLPSHSVMRLRVTTSRTLKS